MAGTCCCCRIKYRIERTAVSGKTDFLVAGFEMDDGRKITEGAQYKAAKKKGVKIISEEEFFAMIEGGSPAEKAAQQELF